MSVNTSRNSGFVGVVLDGEVVEAGIGRLSELPRLSQLVHGGIEAQPELIGCP
jgi:hypothetical protein